MAENTRSKSTKRNNQKIQFENHTNLSDEEMIAETYKDNRNISAPTQTTKKQKTNEVCPSTSSPNTDDNSMAIDDKNEMENPTLLEPAISSHDGSTIIPQTPIINSQDAMDTDLPESNSDQTGTQGSTNTQTTVDTNNNASTSTLDIFKEHVSRSDSKFILFFTRDQFGVSAEKRDQIDKKFIFKITNVLDQMIKSTFILLINFFFKKNSIWSLFPALTPFNKEKSNNDILNDLKNVFLMEKDIVEYRINKTATLEYFTILIGSENTFDKLKDKPITLLNNVAPRIFSHDTIDKLIQDNIDHLKARSVTLLNVPINYDITLLIKHIANFTNSAIDKYKESIPNKRANIRQLPQKLRYNNRSLTYKKVTLTFQDPNAVKYLLEQHKWGLLIENFLIRIVPIDEQCDDYTSRTKPTYVTTGIPLNANVLDMLPLTNHLRARSIEFLPTKAVSLHKVANIYCDITEKDFVLYDKFDTNFQGFKLHIFPAQGFILNNTCGYCGKENHNLYDCPETDYNITPHNKEKKYRKKFLQRQHAYKLKDNIRNSYDQIKSLTKKHDQRPQSQTRFNRYNPNNYKNNNQDNNPQSIPPNGHVHPKGFNPRPKRTPVVHLDNWDNAKSLQANTSSPSTKGKQTVNQQPSDDALTKRINHLETIIKDLSSQIGGLNITQKQQKEDIKLLQEQARLTMMNMEKLNQQLNTINTTLTEQTTTISGVPKIVSFIENMEQNGFFSQFNDNNNYHNDPAYGSDNYAYPPHSDFVDERLFNDEHNDSSSGYESSSTVETHDVFPDSSYTPSRPTGGYPTITTSIGNTFGNMLGLGQRRN
ncbi:hypothetical protein RhiirC2_849484 [Rhizophagus irregularis]|uniref:Uncharacterized protein n=1 Tax=Rhizophagus irregularis TaxID=588596 RepID=A0A2N1NAY1_9GLOM|nr:hypothetical protein RhiirC2_849484 [Rhizophagus irregularis]